MRILFVLASIFFSLCSFSQERMKVGLFSVEPFSHINNKGEIEGISYKFLKELEETSSLSFTFYILPYPRVIKSLKDGSIDIAFVHDNQELNHDSLALIKSLSNENIIVLRPGLEAKTISDLKNVTIAKIRSASYSKDFDENENIKKFDTKDYRQSLSVFLSKRVDGLIIPRAALTFLVNQSKYDSKLFTNQIVVNEKNNWLYVSHSVTATQKNKIIDAHKKLLELKKYKKMDDLL